MDQNLVNFVQDVALRQASLSASVLLFAKHVAICKELSKLGAEVAPGNTGGLDVVLRVPQAQGDEIYGKVSALMESYGFQPVLKSLHFSPFHSNYWDYTETNLEGNVVKRESFWIWIKPAEM